VSTGNASNNATQQADRSGESWALIHRPTERFCAEHDPPTEPTCAESAQPPLPVPGLPPTTRWLLMCSSSVAGGGRGPSVVMPNAHPAGKLLDPAPQVNCLFGLALDVVSSAHTLRSTAHSRVRRRCRVGGSIPMEPVSAGTPPSTVIATLAGTHPDGSYRRRRHHRSAKAWRITTLANCNAISNAQLHPLNSTTGLRDQLTVLHQQLPFATHRVSMA